jgi:hypothetical protein
MNAKITILKGGRIAIAACEIPAIGKVAKTTIDLTPHAGKFVRIWLEDDGTYSLDPQQNHYWQVAELQVPDLSAPAGDAADGETQPLDLSGVEITTWPLPVAQKDEAH